MKYFLCTLLLSVSSLAFSSTDQFDENLQTRPCTEDKFCIGDTVEYEFSNKVNRGTVEKSPYGNRFYIQGHDFSSGFDGRPRNLKLAGYKRIFNPYGADIVNFKLPSHTQITMQEKPLILVDKYCGQIGKGWRGVTCALCAKENDNLDDRIVGLRSMILSSNWSLSEDEAQMTIPILDDVSLKEVRCQVKQGNMPFNPNLRVQDAIMEILNKAGGFSVLPRNKKEI